MTDAACWASFRANLWTVGGRAAADGWATLRSSAGQASAGSRGQPSGRQLGVRTRRKSPTHCDLCGKLLVLSVEVCNLCNQRLGERGRQGRSSVELVPCWAINRSHLLLLGRRLSLSRSFLGKRVQRRDYSLVGHTGMDTGGWKVSEGRPGRWPPRRVMNEG